MNQLRFRRTVIPLMKGRMVFPIRNSDGVIVAYAGRSLKKDDEDGKYRFPSGLVKHQELFNIDRVVRDEATRGAVAKHGIVVVEGFADVLRLHRHGFPNAVGLLGSDFGEPQLEMLLNAEWNLSGKVALFLDNNEAGHTGKRALASALIHRAHVRYANYEAVEDSGKTEPEHFSQDELERVLW